MALGRGFFAFQSAAACWRAKNERFVVTTRFQLPLNLSCQPVGLLRRDAYLERSLEFPNLGLHERALVSQKSGRRLSVTNGQEPPFG